MKPFLKILSITMALCLCFGILSACTDAPEDPVESEETTDINDITEGTSGKSDETDNKGGQETDESGSGDKGSNGDEEGDDKTETTDKTPESSSKLENSGANTDDSFQGWNDFDGKVSVSEPAKHMLANNLTSLKVFGRSMVEGTGITCDFTASGIEFNAYIHDKLCLNVTASKDTYFTGYVDGVRSDTRFYAPAGTTTLNLADFRTSGSHNIRILKQTEAQNSLCVLNYLQFDGQFEQAPAEKNAYIEFIGDSITCGYGNLCANGAANPGTALNQDGTQTFAFNAAESLNADFSMVSCSGIGVAVGYRTFTEDAFFAKQSYYRNQTTAYAPARTPDLVVINLGTNDQSKGADSETFKQKAVELINLVRTTYGADVKIVWAYNMMKSGMSAEVAQVIEALGGESAGLYMCELPRNTAGGGGHPSLEAQISAAAVLTQFIQSKGLLN